MEPTATKLTVKDTKAKIATAFKALTEKGILSRMNFSCCSTCGHFEMDRDASAMAAEGKPMVGYAFYHVQDEAGLRRYASVLIGYNYCGLPERDEANSDRRTKEIGTVIVEAITAVGLKCEWNGEAGTRIGVYQ